MVWQFLLPVLRWFGTNWDQSLKIKDYTLPSDAIQAEPILQNEIESTILSDHNDKLLQINVYKCDLLSSSLPANVNHCFVIFNTTELLANMK